jgi:hypothetical protein
MIGTQGVDDHEDDVGLRPARGERKPRIHERRKRRGRPGLKKRATGGRHAVDSPPRTAAVATA